MIKPTGTVGSHKSEISEDGSLASFFDKVSFPSSKDDVEAFVAVRFIDAMNRHLSKDHDSFILSSPLRNVENDFDFTVSTSNGPAYLELLEAAPLKGSYEHASAEYRSYDHAKFVFDAVQQKSARYPSSGVRDIFLLVYVTDWKFVFSTSVIACLRVWLSKQKTVFRAVFYFGVSSVELESPRWLYPVPPELFDGFDPETVKENVCLNLDVQTLDVTYVRTLVHSSFRLNNYLLPYNVQVRPFQFNFNR
jgi:hypothetical protein